MVAVKLKNICKTYKVYSKQFLRLKDAFLGTKNYTTYNALSNISIEINKGDAVGVLGTNGAGKSTLLKIITGVLKPTEGEVSINGKISAILELNSGFDEEATGYENIYIKGLLLGFSKKDIDSKIDEIVNFADVGEHINQPVKTYSSGMKSRLGFAIAVNVNPDILIIDEALSVGDDVFRTKCLTKMSEFRKKGKTILFVSHSIFTIKSFCNKCMWLKKGELIDYGDMKDVVREYELFLKEQKGKQKQEVKELKNNNLAIKDYLNISSFKFKNKGAKFFFGENIEYSFNYNVKKELGDLTWSFTIRDIDKKELYSTEKAGDNYKIDSSLGEHSAKVVLKNVNLLPGRYMLSGELRDSTGLIYTGYSNKKIFEVLKDDIYRGTGVTYIEHEFKNY